VNAHHPKQTTTSTGLRRKTRWGGKQTACKNKRGKRDAAAREQHASPDHELRSFLQPNLTLPLRSRPDLYWRSHAPRQQSRGASVPPCFLPASPGGGQWRSQTRGQTRPRKPFFLRFFDPTNRPNTPRPPTATTNHQQQKKAPQKNTQKRPRLQNHLFMRMGVPPCTPPWCQFGRSQLRNWCACAECNGCSIPSSRPVGPVKC